MAARKKKVSKKKAIATTGTTMPANFNWEDEMSKHIGRKTDMLKGTGGSQYISTRGGVFTYDGAELPTPLPVIILDSVLEHNYFPGKFDPNDIKPPVCYSIGRDKDELVPHKDSPEPQADTCRDCWANKFNSAPEGRGKACQNRIRLALLPADVADAETMSKATPLLLKLPVMSVAGYNGHVQKIENVLHREEFGVVTLLDIEPDQRSQYKVTFAPEQPVDDGNIGFAIITQQKAIQDALVSFPDPSEAEDTGQSNGRRQVRKKQTARRAPAKKKVVKKKASKKRSSKY